MAGTDKTPTAALLDQLAALDPAQRRELDGELRKVAEALGGVPGCHEGYGRRGDRA